MDRPALGSAHDASISSTQGDAGGQVAAEAVYASAGRRRGRADVESRGRRGVRVEADHRPGELAGNRIDRDQGYSYITPDDGGENLLFSYSAIRGGGFSDLDKGARVRYEVVEGLRAPQAEDVSQIQVHEASSRHHLYRRWRRHQPTYTTVPPTTSWTAARTSSLSALRTPRTTRSGTTQETR
jgi:CspA family cold shock protein